MTDTEKEVKPMTRRETNQVQALQQHTPGPWQVEHPFQEPGVYVSAPTTALVCKLYPTDDPQVILNAGKIEANARLIAAAPDLLVALREMMRQFDYGEDSDAFILAQAAIAKATHG